MKKKRIVARAQSTEEEQDVLQLDSAREQSGIDEENEENREASDSDEHLEGEDENPISLRKIVKKAHKRRKGEVDGEGCGGVVFDKAVGDVMRCILFANMKGNGKISQDALWKLVDGEKVLGRKTKAVALIEARDKFKDVFGFDLLTSSDAPVLISDTKVTADGRKQVPGQSEHFFLVNMLDTKEEKLEHAKTNMDCNRFGFLMTVLGVIMLSDGFISESDFNGWFAESLDTNLGEQGSKLLNGYMKDYIQSGYIHHRKRADEKTKTAVPIMGYSFGSRSLIEITLPNILKYLKSVHGIEGSFAETELQDYYHRAAPAKPAKTKSK